VTPIVLDVAANGRPPEDLLFAADVPDPLTGSSSWACGPAAKTFAAPWRALTAAVITRPANASSAPLRRELLNRVLILGEAPLRAGLAEYQARTTRPGRTRT